MKQITLVVATLAALSLTPVAASAQSKPGMSAPKTQSATVDIQVCNRSGRNATVAVSYVEVGTGQFVNRGWYDVNNGACESLVSTDNSNFYFYADASDGSGRTWSGSHNLCVEYPGPYTFYSAGETECGSGQEVKGFVPAHSDQTGTYTWNLDP
jgi:uncharacterized membrane protein